MSVLTNYCDRGEGRV